MTALEDLIQAAMAAPPERREAALRLLQGNLPKPEPYLTLSELARRLGLCRATLRRWRVPSHDLGGSRRYRLTEVEAYFHTEAFQRRHAALRAERRQERAAKETNDLAAATTGRAVAKSTNPGRHPKPEA
jgi:hypothetical protein